MFAGPPIAIVPGPSAPVVDVVSPELGKKKMLPGNAVAEPPQRGAPVALLISTGTLLAIVTLPLWLAVIS